MRPIHRAAMLAALLVPIGIQAQESELKLGTQAGTRLWVEGGSSVRSWSCDATLVEASVTGPAVPAGASAADVSAAAKRAVLTIPVAKLDCRITCVQSFGFFATVEGLGGDGLLFARDLGREYFRFDEAARQLVGEESGETYRIGQRLELRLADANPVSGSLRFELPEGSYGGASAPRRDRVRKAPAGGRRGRPANIRHQNRRR